ncbi:MAG: amino acid ABC transporter substrate-binding protein [Candidatus Cloacimonadota bacterium]|nr:MAG: amino acid ABC transporter substrate-binding protein [Candidatus Cloacimonadota bacterium]
MKRIIFILIIILICCQGCVNKKNKDKLIVGMELQYPPFEMSDESGNPVGVSVDFAKELGKYLNCEIEIKNIAWAGLIPALQTGKTDMIISSMTITDERKKAVDFSIPYISAGLTLLLSENSSANTFADLNEDGKVVAVKMGTIGEEKAKKYLPKAKIHRFEDVSACVMEVAQGKADAFIYDALTVFSNHKKHPETTRINLEAIEGTEGYWGIAVKKGNKELKQKIDEFIADFRKNNGFDPISDKYLKEIRSVFKENNIPFFFDLDVK